MMVRFVYIRSLDQKLTEPLIAQTTGHLITHTMISAAELVGRENLMMNVAVVSSMCWNVVHRN